MMRETTEEPPRGVELGRNVPREEEQGEIKRNKVESMMTKLKLEGSPYTEMDEETLRATALTMVEGEEEL